MRLSPSGGYADGEMIDAFDAASFLLGEQGKHMDSAFQSW